jgi:hypothetical protein
MPDYDPQSQAFPTPGITLDVSKRVAFLSTLHVTSNNSFSEHFTVIRSVRLSTPVPSLDGMSACDSKTVQVYKPYFKNTLRQIRYMIQLMDAKFNR